MLFCCFRCIFHFGGGIRFNRCWVLLSPVYSFTVLFYHVHSWFFISLVLYWTKISRPKNRAILMRIAHSEVAGGSPEAEAHDFLLPWFWPNIFLPNLWYCSRTVLLRDLRVTSRAESYLSVIFSDGITQSDHGETQTALQSLQPHTRQSGVLPGHPGCQHRVGGTWLMDG